MKSLSKHTHKELKKIARASGYEPEHVYPLKKARLVNLLENGPYDIIYPKPKETGVIEPVTKEELQKEVEKSIEEVEKSIEEYETGLAQEKKPYRGPEEYPKSIHAQAEAEESGKYTKIVEGAKEVVKETEKPKKKKAEVKAENNGELERAIAMAIKPILQMVAAPKSADLDEERVINLIKEYGEVEVTHKIVQESGKTVKLKGRQHKVFDSVLKIATMRQRGRRKNLYLVGPTASGKTTLAENLAVALNLKYYGTSVSLQTTKNDLLGYKGIKGEYVDTQLRQAYEFGGIFLLDEIDKGNPNVLAVINNLTANSVANFPDKMVERHKDFILIAAGNTYGLGNDVQYVGSNKLDAATLNRFVYIKMDYDEKLEKYIAPHKPWFDRVLKIRKAAIKLRIKLIVSPRATLEGGDLLNEGFLQSDVEDMTIFQGIDKATKSKILGEI